MKAGPVTPVSSTLGDSRECACRQVPRAFACTCFPQQLSLPDGKGHIPHHSELTKRTKSLLAGEKQHLLSESGSLPTASPVLVHAVRTASWAPQARAGKSSGSSGLGATSWVCERREV